MSDVFVDITTNQELVSVNAATTEEVVSVTGQTTEEVVQITIEVMTCTPATILLNGNAFLTVNSGASEDISLLDENGAPVIPVSVVGSTITVPNSGGGGNVTIERSDNSQITIATAPSTFVVPDSDVVLKDSADNVLRTVSVMADSSVDETIGDVTVTLQDSNNTDISQNSYLAESSNILIAPDATAVVKDSANNVLHTVNINSNSSSDINIYDTIVQLKDSAGNDIGSPDSYLAESTNNKTAPDGNITLKRSNAATLRSVSVRSNQSKDETIADTTVQLKDSAGTNIGAINSYLAESSNNLTAPDGVANLVDSASNPLSSTNVRSNGSETIIAPDATVTLNGNSFLSPRSNQTVAATLTDEDNVQIPYTQVSNQVKVDMYLYVDPFWETVRDLTLTGNYNNLIL